MAVRLQDIADEAGVSLPTVSHILNPASGRAHRFREQTRRKVTEAAAKLGYRPNAAAKATVSGRFNAISLILGAQFTDRGRGWMAGSLLHGINLACHDAKLLLSMAALSDDELADDAALPGILQQWCSDGLLVNYIVHMPPPVADAIMRHRIPSIYLNVKRDHDAVYPDDEQAARELTQHLIEMDHQRIVYLGPVREKMRWPNYTHYSAADRMAGYITAMTEADLPVRVVHDASIFGSAFTPDAWADVMAHQPTAVVVYNGVGALQVHAATLMSNLRVPDDLSIVTFTDEWSSESARRDFSGMRLPFIEVGQQAVQMLQKKIDQPDIQQPARTLAAAWCEGLTCAQPRR